MAKNKLKSSDSKKAYWKKYPSLYVKHRKAKLERHVLANPNDKQAEKALENNKFEYRRNSHSGGEPRNKQTKERKKLLDKMRLIEVKYNKKSAPEPSYMPMLRKLYEELRPKVRYKRRKKIQT